MSLTEEQDEILELLAGHEEAIASLYYEYAAIFPKYRDFWSELVEEEHEHAEWIRALKINIEEGTARFNTESFNADMINNSIKYLKKLRDHAINNKMYILEALKTAIDLETSFIEKKYFEVSKGNSDLFNSLLENLAKGTKEHIARLAEVWNEVKKPQPRNL
ncbi:MAG: hypothetical protein M1269_03445 [Chloroflexi bacterium]|nr:hypothetical protein [Chloroflexota bacterium]